MRNKQIEAASSEFYDWLKDETGKSLATLKKSLNVELDKHDAARFRTACQSDNALWKRVEPLAGLVRQDNFGYRSSFPREASSLRREPTGDPAAPITRPAV